MADTTIPAESVVHVLRRNDPAITRITIYLHQEGNTDRELARALSENEYVTAVEIVFLLTNNLAGAPSLPANRWSNVWHVLSTKRSLNYIACQGCCPAGQELQRQLSSMPEVIELFFDAIQQHNAITELLLVGLPLAGAKTADMLDAMASLTHFWFASMHHAGPRWQ